MFPDHDNPSSAAAAAPAQESENTSVSAKGEGSAAPESSPQAEATSATQTEAAVTTAMEPANTAPVPQADGVDMLLSKPAPHSQVTFRTALTGEGSHDLIRVSTGLRKEKDVEQAERACRQCEHQHTLFSHFEGCQAGAASSSP